MRNPWVGLFLLMALGLVAYVGFHEAGPGFERERVGIGLPIDVPRTQLSVQGEIEPYSGEIRLVAGMAGRLASVTVEEGASVQRGRVLATLENAEYAARVEWAEAALAASRASLDRLIEGAGQVERDQARARLDEAEARLALAESRRQDPTAEVGEQPEVGAAQESVDLDPRIAAANLAVARTQLEAIESPPNLNERARAEAEVAQAQARLQEARAIHEKSLVRSPVDGVVLSVPHQAGEWVTDSYDDPILILGDMRSLRVRAEVNERDIGLIRLGQTAQVESDAHGGQVFAGRVTRIGALMGTASAPAPALSAAGSATEVLEILIDLEPGVNLPVGLRVRARLQLMGDRET